MDIFEKRAKDLGVTKEDLERALSKFISMLGDDELRMFLNDMSKESCCSPGSGCGCS